MLSSQASGEEPVPDEPEPAPAGHPRRRGLTLIEVVMAISVLVLLTASTIITMVPVSRQNRMSREMELAVTEVRNVLEKVHATPFNDLVTLYPPGLVLPINELNNGKLLISYVNPDADPLVMQVELTWDSEESLGSVSRTFYTVRTE